MDPRIASHFGASARLRLAVAGPENRLPAGSVSFILSDLVGLKRSQQLLSAIVAARGVHNGEDGAGIRTAVRFPHVMTPVNRGATK